MVQQFNIIRGGKESQVNIGITTEGKSRLYFDDTVVNGEGLKTRWYFKTLFIDTNNNGVGEVNFIRTEWRNATLSPVGNLILGTEIVELMITNEADIAAFITMFGMPILMSMSNGLVRDLWGFNHFGVFNPNGTVKTLTVFESNTQPTYDYNSWKTGDPLPESIVEPLEEPE